MRCTLTTGQAYHEIPPLDALGAGYLSRMGGIASG